MTELSPELRAITAVHTPPHAPADRRLTEVRQIDQTYEFQPYPSLAAWEAKRTELRQQILAASGLWPEPPRTPLQPQISGRVERDGYSVENVAFQSRPGLYVTGNLYRPLGVGGRRPGLLNPHGHSRKGRLEHTDNSSTPARCISFARQGYVAFAYDMIGYNDARQLPHHFGGWRDWLWSLGALGLQLWNSMRAMDFLLSLPDVDPERTGCVGESGGGTQTFLLAAVDDRLTHVAPVVMVSAHYQGGCVCENIPNLRLDTFNVEVAAMAAPRPMTLVSATGDWTRNTPTVEFPAIRSIYALYGAEDRLSEAQITAPHNFNQGSREAVYRFFSRWFRGTPIEEPIPEAPLTPEPDETLRVFPERLPADALDSAGIRSATRKLAQEQLDASWPRDEASLEAFRKGLGTAYRQALDSHPIGPEHVKVDRVDRQGEQTYGEHRAARLLIGREEQGDRLPALWFAGNDGTPHPLVLAHGTGKAALFLGQDGQAEPGSLLEALLKQGRSVLLFDAFLTGDYQTPAAQSGRDQSSSQFTTFNRTDAALRVQDVVTAVAAARQLAGAESVDLIGLADAGLWCILARPLALGVATLIADGADFDWSSDDDYLARLYIPGIRRAGDLATALALGAPGSTRLFALNAARITERVQDLYSSLSKGAAFSVQTEAAPDEQVIGWLS